jgi:hypothetical protein
MNESSNYFCSKRGNSVLSVITRPTSLQNNFPHYFNIVIHDHIIIYKTIILRVILYGCETWSLTLREEHRLRMFENRVLRWMFGPKRDEVTGEWRKLHNEELHDLYTSPSIIRIMKSRRMRWEDM